MESPKNNGAGFIQKLRSGRFTTTFSLLVVLTLGILAGSVLTSSVSANGAQHIDSSDAHALTIPSPVTLSNGFSAIVKQVGPAVVNINTESLPKAPKRQRGGRRGIPVPAPQNPNGDDDNGGDQGDMQDFFNRFFGGGGNGGGQEGPDAGLGLYCRPTRLHPDEQSRGRPGRSHLREAFYRP
jgi:serine protease Do